MSARPSLPESHATVAGGAQPFTAGLSCGEPETIPSPRHGTETRVPPREEDPVLLCPVQVRTRIVRLDH